MEEEGVGTTGAPLAAVGVCCGGWCSGWSRRGRLSDSRCGFDGATRVTAD